MTKYAGRSLILKLGTGGAGGVVAGLTNLTFTQNNESVDVTDKDSNGWRDLLEGAGTKSISISGDGIASNAATYETLKGYAQANSHNIFQITCDDTDLFEGTFMITSFSETGGVSGAQTFSLSMESTGAITFTNA